MEEKHVHKTSWLAVASLSLGLLAFLSSYLFIYMAAWVSATIKYFPWQLDILLSYFPQVQNTMIIISSLIGLAALLTGIPAVGRVKGKSPMGVAGIILGALAILGGYPLLLLVLLW